MKINLEKNWEFKEPKWNESWVSCDCKGSRAVGSNTERVVLAVQIEVWGRGYQISQHIFLEPETDPLLWQQKGLPSSHVIHWGKKRPWAGCLVQGASI